MSCSDKIQLLIAGIIAAGVLVALFLPICQECKRRQRQLWRVKQNVSLYLDVLEIKLAKAISDLSKVRKVSSENSSFEQDNKINYNAIEQQYLDANVLGKKELEILMKFVRSFKVSKNMEKLQEYKTFLDQVRKQELRKIFPRGVDLDEEIKAIADC